MSRASLLYNLPICSTLKTREQIFVTTSITIEPALTYRVSLAIGYESRDLYYDYVGVNLQAKVRSVTNHWALQFDSPDAACVQSSYPSLTNCLLAITSQDYSVSEAIVEDIVAGTPRPEPKPLLLPPPSPPVPHVLPPNPIERALAKDFEEFQDRTIYAAIFDKRREELEERVRPFLKDDERMLNRVSNAWINKVAKILFPEDDGGSF